MAGKGITRDFRSELDRACDKLGLVEDAAGMLLSDLNTIDFVDRNHVHRTLDLRNHGMGRSFTSPPPMRGQW